MSEIQSWYLTVRYVWVKSIPGSRARPLITSQANPIWKDNIIKFSLFERSNLVKIDKYGVVSLYGFMCLKTTP